MYNAQIHGNLPNSSVFFYFNAYPHLIPSYLFPFFLLHRILFSTIPSFPLSLYSFHLATHLTLTLLSSMSRDSFLSQPLISSLSSGILRQLFSSPLSFFFSFLLFLPSFPDHILFIRFIAEYHKI